MNVVDGVGCGAGEVVVVGGEGLAVEVERRWRRGGCMWRWSGCGEGLAVEAGRRGLVG